MCAKSYKESTREPLLALSLVPRKLSLQCVDSLRTMSWGSYVDQIQHWVALVIRPLFFTYLVQQLLFLIGSQ